MLVMIAPRPTRYSQPSHPRRAASLVELLIGLTLATMVILLGTSQIMRQQRAYDDVTSAIDLRARLRDGADVLSADIRGSYPVGDTFLVALDTAVEFYSVVGASTLCATPAPNRIILPPDSLPSGRILSAWATPPDTGDYAAIFTDSSAGLGRGWQRARVASVTTSATAVGCPSSEGLLSSVDAATSARTYDIALEEGYTATASRGAPVRIVRRVRYSVYRGGDGKWYLGYRRCSPVCAAIQPVSGPYQSAVGAPLTFRYFTSTGTVFSARTPTTDVGRVEIVSRAYYARPIRLPGMASPSYGDSATTVITLRNR
jgi:hypothetical protein